MQVRNQRRWAVLRQQLEEMERRGAKLERRMTELQAVIGRVQLRGGDLHRSRGRKRRMTELQAQNELLRELQREQQEPALRAPIRRRAEGRSRSGHTPSRSGGDACVPTVPAISSAGPRAG